MGIFSARTFATAPPSTPNPSTVQAVANEAAKTTPPINAEAVQDLASTQAATQHIVENLPVWQTFKNSYLSWINPGNWAEAYIEGIHYYTGLPWWVSIIAAVVGIRTLLIPVAVRSVRYSLIMKELQPKVADIMLRTRIARQENNYSLMRQLSAELSTTYQKYGTTPFSGIKFAMIQAPIFLSFFWALRKMSEQVVPGFTEGGWNFFTDLSAFDPYMRLPFLSAILFAVSAEWGTESIRNTPNPTLSRVIMYGFAFLSIIVSRYFPMALHIYWCSSSIFSLITMRIIKKAPYFQKYLYDWKGIGADGTSQLAPKLFTANPLKKKGTGVQAPADLNKQLKTGPTNDIKEKK